VNVLLLHDKYKKSYIATTICSMSCCLWISYFWVLALLYKTWLTFGKGWLSVVLLNLYGTQACLQLYIIWSLKKKF